MQVEEGAYLLDLLDHLFVHVNIPTTDVGHEDHKVSGEELDHAVGSEDLCVLDYCMQLTYNYKASNYRYLDGG